MFSQITTYALYGLRIRTVTVDVDVEDGSPAFAVKGLPDGSTEDARELLRSAITQAGFSFPDDKRVEIRVAPKPILDSEIESLSLAVAVGILAASGQLTPGSFSRAALAGDLRPDGTIAPVRGALQMAEAVAEDRDLDALALASVSAPEAAWAAGVEVLQLYSLAAVRYLSDGDRERLQPEPRSLPSAPDPGGPDFADIAGIDPPRRAAEIAVAGSHSLLLAAPVGAGQPLVARRIPSILPPLRQAEALEVLHIASASKERNGPQTAGRPFRSPGCDVDFLAMVGEGHPPGPGEITLAHHGVLYLDQVLSFDPEILDAVEVARGGGSTLFLVASTALCPCGCFAAPDRLCSCDPSDLARYQHRLAAAVERFDIVSSYVPPTKEDLARPPGEPSCSIRSRILEARARQAERLGEGRTNQQMSAGETQACGLSAEAVAAINRAFPYPHLVARRIRVAQVARTVADLAGSEQIDAFHVAEAIDLQFGRPRNASRQPHRDRTGTGPTRKARVR